MFLAKPRAYPLWLAVPASYSSTEHSLMLKTVKWGCLGRLAAIYRVTRIVIYIDRSGVASEARLGRLLLDYMVAAPYLRKHLFPLRSELRYAGVLPPLQLPTHGVGGPSIGECREALVVSCRDSGEAVLEAGLGFRARIRLSRCRPGSRIVVCIESLRPLRLRAARPGEVYAGFHVSVVDGGLRGLLRAIPKRFIRVATSRLGQRVTPGLLASIARGASRRGLAVVFGAPDRGLYEFAEAEGVRLEEEFSHVLNTVPGQGTRTVRVEEAVAATLALLNLYLP